MLNTGAPSETALPVRVPEERARWDAAAEAEARARAEVEAEAEAARAAEWKAEAARVGLAFGLRAVERGVP